MDFGRYSCVELVKEYDNLVVTQTFSKSRSLAGMRVGMAFASAELISYMQAVKDSYNSYPLDQIAIETAVASLSDEEYFKATVERSRQQGIEQRKKCVKWASTSSTAKRISFCTT